MAFLKLKRKLNKGIDARE